MIIFDRKSIAADLDDIMIVKYCRFHRSNSLIVDEGAVCAFEIHDIGSSISLMDDTMPAGNKTIFQL